MKKSMRLLVLLLAALFLLTFVGCGQGDSESDTSDPVSGDVSDIGGNDTNSSITDSSDNTTTGNADVSDVTTAGSSGNTTAAGGDQPVGTTTSRSKLSVQTKPTVSVSGSNTSGRVKDLGGRTIILQDINHDKTTESYKTYKANIEAIEKQLNCKIQSKVLVGESGGNTDITMSILSGQPIVDILIQNGNIEYFPRYKAGLLIDLKSLNVFDFDNGKWDNSCMTLMTKGNKVYGIRWDAAINTSWRSFVLLYNAKLLDEYIPQYSDKLSEWQKNGQWTWAKFEEVCKAFNQAAGSDPAMTACYDQSGLLYCLQLATRGTDWIVMNNKGGMEFNGHTSLAQEAMNVHKKYVSEGMIQFGNPQMQNNAWAINMVGDQENNKYSFIQGQALFGFNTIEGYYCNVAISTVAQQSVRDNVGVMMVPKVKESDSYLYMTPVSATGHSIPYGVKKPAEVATVMNLLMCEPLVSSDAKQTKASHFAQYIEPTLNKRTSDLSLHTFNTNYDEFDAGNYDILLSTYGIVASTNIWGDFEKGWVGKYLYDISNGSIAQSAAIAAVKNTYNKVLAEY